MTSVTVSIVGGTEKENTTAVTVGSVRWGLNGTAKFGEAQDVTEGSRTLTVYKTTDPKQIATTVNVPATATTFGVTVNKDTISVAVS